MKILSQKSKTFKIGLTSVVLLALSYPAILIAQNPEGYVISQKNRTYAPGKIEIAKGDTVTIVNDDIFIHHAFVDSDKMEFDSGSMDEGESIEILFNEAGTFKVKCAIHPKMNLDVTVK